MLGKLEVFFKINNRKVREYISVYPRGLEMFKCNLYDDLRDQQSRSFSTKPDSIKFSKNPLFMCGSNSNSLYE